MHSQAIAVDDVCWEDLDDPHTITWADAEFFSGTTQDGRHIFIALGQHSESWAFPTAEMAHEHMVREVVGLSEVCEDPEHDFTLAWPYQRSYGDRYFVGTRMVTNELWNGPVRWYSVLRVGDCVDLTEHEDAASALEEALEGAAQLVDHVVAEVDDDDAPLIEAFLRAQIHDWHATLWMIKARQRVEEAPVSAVNAEPELAQRLHLSFEGVEFVLNKAHRYEEV